MSLVRQRNILNDDDICPAYVQVVKATETDGWKSDCPDMLEVVSFM